MVCSGLKFAVLVPPALCELIETGDFSGIVIGLMRANVGVWGVAVMGKPEFQGCEV